MKIALTLIAAVATLCLSSCDTIGYKSRNNNTGPGAPAGPNYVWGPRLESSMSVKERRELDAARRAPRPAPTPAATATTPVGS